ncbi:MAG: dephospho-CoA kinase [Flavobacteriaceae bacterium]|nr:dephospho-CoA kinase [Flavobacteriaceae bacterium]
MTKIVGLTGGIGSGKSTVLELFKDRGVAVYVADVEAKRLMSEHSQLKKEITALLGEKAYVNGQLNRKYIAQQVFNNPQKLQELNHLVHPKVREDFLSFSKNCKSEIVIYETAILFESGSDALCDFVISVVANEKERIKRVMKRDNCTEEEVRKRIENQLSDEERIRKSDFVICNDNLALLEKKVNDIFLKLRG